MYKLLTANFKLSKENVNYGDVFFRSLTVFQEILNANVFKRWILSDVMKGVNIHRILLVYHCVEYRRYHTFGKSLKSQQSRIWAELDSHDYPVLFIRTTLVLINLNHASSFQTKMFMIEHVYAHDDDDYACLHKILNLCFARKF